MTAWPADAVERRPVAELIPYARNARLHSDAQVRQIAASIKEWGWTVPVLVDEEGVLIAGHGRVLAAQLLKIVAIPVMVARGWSKAQIQAYRLADNRPPLSAEWDPEMLKVEVEELQEIGFDLELTGFGAHEIEDLFHEWGSGDEAAVTRHGENLDGIEARVVVRCPQEQKGLVVARIKEALAELEGVSVE